MENEKKVDAPKEQRPVSYEELNNIAHQLAQQNEQYKAKFEKLVEAYNRAQMTNVFTRLDFLFKVLKEKESFTESFVKMCALEIENTITLPKEEEEVTNENPTE